MSDLKEEVLAVTGGLGFLGAWTARLALERGAKVVLFDLPSATRSVLFQVLSGCSAAAWDGVDVAAALGQGQQKLPPRLQVASCDISDLKAVESCFEAAAPTLVVHLAAMQIPLVAANPPRGALVNVVGTTNILEAIRKLRETQAKAGATRTTALCFASSAAVLGPESDYQSAAVGAVQGGGPLGTTRGDSFWAGHRPRTLYGAFKLCNEACARIYAEQFQVPSVALRPLTIFGLGREVGLTSGPTKAIKAAVLNRSFEVPVKGPTGFQWVRDVALMFIELGLAARAAPPASHVVSLRGDVISVEQFLAALEKLQAAGSGNLQTIVNRIPKLIKLADAAAEVPIAAEVQDEVAQQLLAAGKRPGLQWTPLDQALLSTLGEMSALAARGALPDKDLLPPPSPPPAKL